MKGQNDQNSIITQLEEDGETRDKIWTAGVFKKTLIRRIPDISRNLRIPADLEIKTTRLPDTPPWKPPTIKLRPDLIQPTKKEDSDDVGIVFQMSGERPYCTAVQSGSEVRNVSTSTSHEGP